MDTELLNLQSHDTLKQAIDSYKLHEFLEIKTVHRDWMKRILEGGYFLEEEDYAISTRKITKKGRPQKHYYLSVKMASFVITNATHSDEKLRKAALEHIGGPVCVTKVIRKETAFIEDFNSAFDIFCDKFSITQKPTFIEQYPVLKFKIDLYSPELNIAIEFDENGHKGQEEADEFRQKRIEAEIGCQFLRQKEDEDMSVLFIEVILEALILGNNINSCLMMSRGDIGNAYRDELLDAESKILHSKAPRSMWGKLFGI